MVHQYCHRCRTRLPVYGTPAAWCPRCGGVMSAPTDRPPRVRWVAVPPPRPAAPRRVRRPVGPTPRYRAVPRWGLRDVPRSAVADLAAPSTTERATALASTLRVLLVALAGIAAIGAVAQCWRYVLAVRGRTQLVGARPVRVSDAIGFASAVLVAALGVAAIVLGVLWLLRARDGAATQAGLRDTRPPWQVCLGVLLPVANLVLPAVWLTELEHRLSAGQRTGTPRPPRLLLAWWASWAAVQVLLAFAVVWHFRDSAQARADTIVVLALLDVAVLGCAVLGVVLLRRLGARLAGPRRADAPRRWVVAVPARGAEAETDRVEDPPVTTAAARSSA